MGGAWAGLVGRKALALLLGVLLNHFKRQLIMKALHTLLQALLMTPRTGLCLASLHRQAV